MALALGLLSGCSRPSPAVVDTPPELAAIALLELDEGGALIRATGLQRWAPGAGLPVFTGEAGALIVGWREADLRGAGLDSLDDEAARSALAAAEGCAPRLPAPIWAARARQSGALEILDPEAAAPRLTAPWTLGACPEVPASALSFAGTCKEFRCAQQVTPLDRCSFSVDLSACDLGRHTLRFDSTGAACMTSEPPVACTPAATAPAHTALRLDCTQPVTCGIDVMVAPSHPPLSVRGAAVLDSVPLYDPPPGLTGGTPMFPVQGRVIGYAYDALPLESDAVVSVGPGTPIEACGSADLEGSLRFFDLETLAPSRTATAPPCLARLSPDPAPATSNGGFLGVFARGSGWSLARFDPSGRLLEHTVTPLDPGRDPAAGPCDPARIQLTSDRPTALEVIGGGGAAPTVLVLLDGSTRACADRGSFLLTFDAATLRHINRFNYDKEIAFTMSSAGGGTVAIGDSKEDKVLWIEVSTGAVLSTTRLPVEPARNDNAVTDVTVLDAQGLTLMSIARSIPAIHVIDRDDRFLGRAIFVDTDAQPIAAHPWPSDTRLALIAGTARRRAADWPSVVALLDVEQQKLVPGSIPIGYGAIGRIREDRAGRLWMLLPWEPKLVRVERLPPR